jgi:hypothetical protein
MVLDCRRDVVLLQEDAVLGTRRFNEIKAMIAKPLHGVFEGSFFNFGWQNQLLALSFQLLAKTNSASATFRLMRRTLN